MICTRRTFFRERPSAPAAVIQKARQREPSTLPVYPASTSTCDICGESSAKLSFSYLALKTLRAMLRISVLSLPEAPVNVRKRFRPLPSLILSMDAWVKAIVPVAWSLTISIGWNALAWRTRENMPIPSMSRNWL